MHRTGMESVRDITEKMELGNRENVERAVWSGTSRKGKRVMGIKPRPVRDQRDR